MSDTTFVNGSTLSDADWFNDLNRLHYTILSDPADVAAVKATLHAAPGAIGGTTPAAGAFTTITSTGGVQTTGVVASGYGTGAGGTVTQATSKSTDVTLNKPCGQVVMNNANLAAGAKVTFMLNNSTISSTDVISVSVDGTSMTVDQGVYAVSASAHNSKCYITLYNNHSIGIAEAVVINFVVHNSVIS